MSKLIYPLLCLLFFTQNLDAQTDTVPPVLVCKGQFMATIGTDCYVTVQAAELLDTVYDNSSSIVQLGLRRPCVGSGFPAKDFVQFVEVGLFPVEVWARDVHGNTSACNMNIFVNTFNGSCGVSLIGILALTPLEESIDSVKLLVKGQNCLADTIDFEDFTTDEWSLDAYLNCYECPTTPGYDLQIIPSKNNDFLNGVTTYDLTLLSKHILGTQPLDSPYKIIAADANQDGKVTMFDVIILRRLILGLIDSLPNGKSWRFIPENYTFPNPENPFVPPFPEKMIIANETGYGSSDLYFRGIKIGDLNFSANPK